mmetsp:Transcript_56173/g.122862  ORF Transcript_56173/g.122862 Transcript_56173/m.122862 type:complete len:242 (+) Transcript_56173:672-1397(+)
MTRTFDSAFLSSARTSFFLRASSSSFSIISFSRTVSLFALETKTGFIRGPRLSSSSDSDSYSLSSSGTSSCSSSSSALRTSSSIFRLDRALSRSLSRRICWISKSSSSALKSKLASASAVGFRSMSSSSLKTSFFSISSSSSSSSFSRMTASSTRRCRKSLWVPVSVAGAASERCRRANLLLALSEALLSRITAAAWRRRLEAFFRSSSGSSLFFFSVFFPSSAHSGTCPRRYLATFLVPS